LGNFSSSVSFSGDRQPRPRLSIPVVSVTLASLLSRYIVSNNRHVATSQPTSLDRWDDTLRGTLSLALYMFHRRLVDLQLHISLLPIAQDCNLSTIDTRIIWTYRQALGLPCSVTFSLASCTASSIFFSAGPNRSASMVAVASAYLSAPLAVTGVDVPEAVSLIPLLFLRKQFQTSLYSVPQAWGNIS
jgi:hypothetical protein